MPMITFSPSGRKCEVPSGTLLLDACRLAGVALPAPCGGKGICGKCRVRLLPGSGPLPEATGVCIPASLVAAGWRAACTVRVEGNLVLADPDGDMPVDFGHAAFACREMASDCWKRDLILPVPSAADRRDDATRLLDALRAAGIDLPEAALIPHLRDLPRLLRQDGFRCRVWGMGDTLVRVGPPGGADGPALGLAVDLGTTTVAAALCDLADGAVLATGARANPQAVRGDDVVSRLEYASRGAEPLRELSRLALDVIRELAEDLARRAGMEARPMAVAVAGNTVMTHILLDVDPAALGHSPFVPAFCGPVRADAAILGWPEPCPPALLTLPNVASYLGGDVVAGLLAHGIDRSEETVLFLDVGTNGEMVLAAGGDLIGCAAAAGPAFEGARIRQGMRATAGAICRVDAAEDGDLAVRVIGAEGERARGVCGTGLLDAVAVLLRAGVVDGTGRMLEREEAAADGIGGPLLARMHESEDGPAIWLEYPSAAGGGVALTARDVREFQLAKGAIGAGVRILVGRAGVSPGDLHRVILAGGFGAFLRPESAIAVGLLPREVDAARVEAVGNAALAGARVYLLSGRERSRADQLRRRVRYMDLSGLDDFAAVFAEEMLFPEG